MNPLMLARLFLRARRLQRHPRAATALFAATLGWAALSWLARRASARAPIRPL